MVPIFDWTNYNYTCTFHQENKYCQIAVLCIRKSCKSSLTSKFHTLFPTVTLPPEAYTTPAIPEDVKPSK
jgi:hypothetical protein